MRMSFQEQTIFRTRKSCARLESLSLSSLNYHSSKNAQGIIRYTLELSYMGTKVTVMMNDQSEASQSAIVT